MNPSTSNAGDVRPYQAVIVLFVCWLCLRAYWWTSMKAGRAMDIVTAEAVLKLAVWLPTCLLFVWLMRRGRPLWAEVGLDGGLLSGVVFGCVATIPMFLAWMRLAASFDADVLIGSALVGPFAEEFLFRGFVFRQLVRRAGWSVPAAIAVSSLLFGLAHIRSVDFDYLVALRGPFRFGASWVSRGGVVITYWSSAEAWWSFVSTKIVFDFATALPYAAGGAVFAWIVHRWNSLWPAIALHSLINLWWVLTPGEHARLGFSSDLLSVAQLLSIGLAIWLTIRRASDKPPPASAASLPI